MIYVVTPTIQKKSGIIETIVPMISVRGALCETAVINQTVKAGFVEMTAIPVQILTGTLDIISIAVKILAGTIDILTPSPALAPVFKAFIMNTRTGGVATYTNFPFSSIFAINKKYYGVIDGAGLYELTGTNDAGVNIDAEIESGVSNLGSDKTKSPIDAWLELRGSGSYEFVTVHNEDLSDIATYTVDGDNDFKHGFKRIKLSKGVQGTHIQIKFKNVDGSNFDLQTIRVMAALFKRRKYGR
jgi:hypothetical protein